MKRLMVVATVVWMTCVSQAFSLLGPWADWQTPYLCYQLDSEVWGANALPRDPGGPMTLREGYRWNIPVVTYAIDKSFLDVFGEKGVEEIDRAFETVNVLFRHMYTDPDFLETVPTLVTRFNYRAMALGLQDLYTYALSHIVEKMGLAAPERFCWTLRTANQPARPAEHPTPPSMYYTVHRNYDPLELETSPYINGTLYSYQIIQAIFASSDGGTIADDAMEIIPDPTAIGYTTVAGSPLGNLLQGTSRAGLFYSGLSRDDVGGLQWLYSVNNYAFEGLGSGTGSSASMRVPDENTVMIVTNMDLAQFLIDVENTTNTLAQVQALYPTLNITDYSWTNTLAITTNMVTYYTNLPWTPSGSDPILRTNFTYTTNIQFRYNYLYDNVYTNYGGKMAQDYLYLITVTSDPASPWMPYPGDDTYSTNVTVIPTNRVTGGILIMGGTVAGGTNGTEVTSGQISDYQFVYTNPYPMQIWITNLLVEINGDGNTDTNTVDNTGTAGTSATTDGGTTTDGTTDGTDDSTNAPSYFAQYLVNTFKTYEYVVHPITWDGGTTTETQTNTTILYRPGLGTNFAFLKVNFDNLVGNTFTSTNLYLSNVFYMKMRDNVLDPVTNAYGQLESTVIRRLITWPDIVISAADLGVDTVTLSTKTSWVNHANDNRALSGVGGMSVSGPGIIIPGGGYIVFNSLNEYWVNEYSGPLSLFEQENGLVRYWASYDGTTNAPVIYPANAGITVEWLERQVTNSPPIGTIIP